MKKEETLESDSSDHSKKNAMQHTMTNSNSEQQQLHQQQQQYSNTLQSSSSKHQQKYMAGRYKYIPARVRECQKFRVRVWK